MSEWEIPGKTVGCAGCTKEFSPGEGHYSFLYEEPEGFRRLDYCQTCRSGAKEPFFSFWKTTRAEEEKKPLVADDVLLKFFLRLYETQEKKACPPSAGRQRRPKDFLFVLALALERRRILKRIGRSRETLELELVKEKVAKGDPVRARRRRGFQIPLLKLGEEAICGLTEEVGRLLGGGSLVEPEGGG